MNQKKLALCLVGIILLGAACGPSTYYSRGDEERNPYYQRAKRAVETREYREAVGLYEKALLVNPHLANAHLEIGLLYDDKLSDPIAAIYHYRQYLELCRDCSKKQLVEDFIERAKLSFAASLPQAPISNPGDVTRVQTENANLVQQNALLQTRVAELEKQLVGRPVRTVQPPAPPPSLPAPVPVRVVTPPPPPPPPTVVAESPRASVFATPAAERPAVAAQPSPPESTPRGRYHVVQKGDTLYSLAMQYYGTQSAWDRIYAANREQLPTRNGLKIGQRLLIPR